MPQNLLNPTAATETERQALTNTALRREIAQLIEQMKATYLRCRTLVKLNPYGLTEEQVWAGLGEEDAEELLRLGDLLKTTVNEVVPDSLA